MIFGTLPSGETVERHVLSAGRLRASVLSYGAILQTLEVSGVNVVLGLPTLEDYLTRSRYFGAVVGRYGNRIADGRFTLDGVEYRLPVNNGPNSLHGGTDGFDRRVWAVSDATGSSMTLTLTSPDGDQGYPGTLTASVTYTLTGEVLDDDACEEILEPYRGHRFRVQSLLGMVGSRRPRRAPRMTLPTHTPYATRGKS